MKNLTIKNIFDLQQLQSLQDSFSNATGISLVIVNKDGYVTSPSNFKKIYLNFFKGKNDLYKIKDTYESFKPTTTTTNSGIINFEIPIMVENVHIGSIFGGQVLDSPLNTEVISIYASSLGVDEEKYKDLASELPVVSISRILASINLLLNIIHSLVNKWEQLKSFSNLYKYVIEKSNSIIDCLKSFYTSSEELNRNQENLIEEIENINTLLIEINNIVKSVSSLADETQMISFNASIEAARVGEQGKSFTVIAGEIRRLSEQSKKTVANIQNFTATIQSSISKTSDHSEQCIDSIKSELSELNKIDTYINKVLNKLNEMKLIEFN